MVRQIIRQNLLQHAQDIAQCLIMLGYIFKGAAPLFGRYLAMYFMDRPTAAVNIQ